MNIDKNEAFRHNSCKKLAQLTKVITSLNGSARDKLGEQAVIVVNYEDSISKLFERHKKQVAEIHTGLIRFRKSCVEKYCSEYGGIYRQLKGEYASCVKQSNQRFNQIAGEIDAVKTEIDGIRSEIESTSKDVDDSAGALFSEKASQEQRSGRGQKAEMDKATAEWSRKTAENLAQFEKTVKEMATKHKKTKAELRGELAKLMKTAVRARIGKFKECRSKTTQLKTQVVALRKRFNAMMTAHQKASKRAVDAKTANMKEVVVAAQDRKQHVVALGKQINAEGQKARTDVGALEKDLQNRRNNWKVQIDDVAKKIEELEAKSAKLGGSEVSHRSALASIMDSYIKEFEEDTRAIKDRHERINKAVQAACVDANEFYRKSAEVKERDLLDLSAKKAALEARIAKANTALAESLEKERRAVAVVLEERLVVMRKTVDEANAAKSKQHKSERDELAKLTGEFAEFEKSQRVAIEKAQQQVVDEVQSFEDSLKSRIEQRRKEKQTAFERKVAEKDKKLGKMQQRFSAEREEKAANYKQLRDAKLNEVQKEYDQPNDETNSHEQRKKQLDSMLQFLVTQIEGQKAQNQKAIEKFNADLSASDKMKRQVQRRIETETRGIDDEYEMKIQVAQVDLQKSIENISKLYDSDENKRGREVIEMVRKVRQTRSRVDDFLRGKDRELEDLVKENARAEDALKDEIQKMTSQSRENAIKQQLQEQEASIAAEVKEIEVDADKQVAGIDVSISKAIADTEKAKIASQNAAEKRLSAIQQEMDGINSLIAECEREKDVRLAGIRAEYNKREEDAVRAGNQESDRARNRKNALESRKLEADEELATAYEKQKVTFDEDVTNGLDIVWKTMVDGQKSSKEKLASFDVSIEELWSKRANLEMHLFEASISAEDSGKIAELQTELASQTVDLPLRTERIIALLEQGPTDPPKGKNRGKGGAQRLEKLAPLSEP